MKIVTPWTATVVVLGAIATSAYFYLIADRPEPVAHQPHQAETNPATVMAYAPPGTVQPATATMPGSSAPASPEALPTPEQQQTFSQVQFRLHDPSYRRTHSYREFFDTSMAEWRTLPQAMQDQLLNEFNGMIERGEIDPNQFVPEPETPTPAVAATPPPAPPTAAQQQAYENIKNKLRDPSFTQTRTLNQLAALPEVQRLPPALRAQLTSEAMEMLQRGELRVRAPGTQEATN